MRGALLGSLVIATIANGLNIGGYSTGTIYMVTGIILLLAVTLDTIARRLQMKSGSLRSAGHSTVAVSRDPAATAGPSRLSAVA